MLKRFLIIFVICTIVTAGCDIALWYLSPSDVTYRQEGAVSHLDYHSAGASNCSIDGDGKYVVLGPDPQLHFSIGYENLSSLMIYLNAPLKHNTTVQLFYVGDHHSLSEENSVCTAIRKGTKQIAFSLPEDYYSFLRLDLDDEMVIDHISFSDGAVSRILTPPIRWIRIIVFGLILSLLVFLYTSVPAVIQLRQYLKEKALITIQG